MWIELVWPIKILVAVRSANDVEAYELPDRNWYRALIVRVSVGADIHNIIADCKFWEGDYRRK